MKKFILLLSCYFIAILSTTAQTFSGGSGTQVSPYLISTKADMEALANAVNAVISGKTYSGQYFLLTNNLTGSDAITTSVGRGSYYDSPFNKAFSGIFDGGGHEIEVNNGSGVFEYLKNATVQNLGVRGVISPPPPPYSAGNCAGGICDYAQNATIKYCYNSATVITTSTTDGGEMAVSGGICGTATACSISNCYNLGAITSTTSLNSNPFAGGICGRVEGESTSISNCYNLGDISSYNTGTGTQTPPCVGGICGAVFNETSIINNCFSANSLITAKHNDKNSNTLVGRISGINIGNSIISNCYALSSMTINGSTVSSTDANGRDGSGTTLSSFQSQSWIATNLGWDFNTIWTMSSSGSENKGLPVFKKYTITASAGNNGSISPSTNQSVTYGSSQYFAFIPNSGYVINQVLVNNVNNSTAVANGYYTFQNVTTNQSISVTFKQVVPPTVTTLPATNITQTSATLNKTVAAGTETITAQGFKYKLASANTWSTSTTGSLTGLTAGTQYQFYAYATTASDTVNGNTLNFTTLPVTIVPPTVTTLPATDITQTSATLNKTVTAGTEAIIDQGFKIKDGNTWLSFSETARSVNFINMVANTQYEFYAYATTASGTVNGNTLTFFTTKSCLPNLIVQIWDDVLSVINDPTTNGGYTFQSYQWQKNGIDMSGETAAYLYFSNAKDYDAEYSVLLTTTNGQQFQSCPVRLRNDVLRSYPNPTSGIVTVQNTSIQAGDIIEIYDMNGQLVQQFSAAEKQTTIDLSALKRGTYILKVNGKQVKIIKNEMKTK
jgi:hypothetical protein